MAKNRVPKPASSGLGIRIAAAAVMTPIALGLIWLGSIWFTLFAAVLGIAISIEWCDIVHEKSVFQKAHHAFAAIVAAFSVYIGDILIVAGIVGVIWAISFIQALRSGRAGFWAFVGVFYVAIPIAALVILRADTKMGFVAVLLLFGAVATADTFAYFVGKIVGGPKLWPSVSPNKTWAGLVGAILGGMAATVLVFVIFRLDNYIAAVLLGAAIGVVEQGGDLFESAAKRKFNIKDSGSIIPGHGGVLDRIDGLMAASVMALIVGSLHAAPNLAATGFLGW